MLDKVERFDAPDTCWDWLSGNRPTPEQFGRASVVGLFQARSHPDWDLPSVGAALVSTEEATVSDFLAELSDTSVCSIYHAVRQLRYGGVGVRRSAEAVLQERSGSCSGKHLALAQVCI